MQEVQGVRRKAHAVWAGRMQKSSLGSPEAMRHVVCQFPFFTVILLFCFVLYCINFAL